MTTGTNGSGTEKRKDQHIRICLAEDVRGKRITNGFEHYRFRHEALPELKFEEIRLASSFLGKPLRAPMLVSCMTGGTELAADINRRLAEAAEARGWAMGLGSIRAALENEAVAKTFQIRRYAPTVPVIANLGAVQLNAGCSPDDCLRAVHLAEADALVLHLNAMQEIFQPEGDTDFRGLLWKIADVCRALPVPVGVKEVGWGIGPETARRLSDAGVRFIDVAGAGGTSWSEVERFRAADPILSEAAATFAGWGTPTAECVRDVRAALPGMAIIASGGMTDGLEAAKAIALGADLVGFGRAVLPVAAAEDGDPAGLMERIEFELRAAMFGIGAPDLQTLQGNPALLELGASARER